MAIYCGSRRRLSRGDVVIGAAAVTLVYREPVWRIPCFIGGISFKRLRYIRAQEQQSNGWGRNALQRTAAAVFKTSDLGEFPRP